MPEHPANPSLAAARRTRSRFGTVGWALAFLLLAIVGIESLWWPMGRDQGIFAWVGSVVAKGGAPYTDAWDVKGPATYLIYALVQLVFGPGMWGIRLLDVIALAIGAVLSWHALGRLGAGRGAWLAPFVFVAWYWQFGFWNSAQPDSWIGLLLLAALALAVLDPDARGLGVAAGIGALIAVCALLKPLYACLLILPALHALYGRERGPSGGMRYTAVSLAGFAAIVGPVLGWLALKGALGEFLRIQIEFNRVVHSAERSLTASERLLWLYRFYVGPERLLALPLAYVGAVAAWRSRRRFFVVTLAALILAVGAVVLQGKYYYYHFVPVGAPLALLAGVGIGRIAGPGTASTWRRQLASALVLTIVTVNLAGLTVGALPWMQYVAGSLSKRDYYARFGRGQPDFSFQECRFAARQVAEMTRPDDTVLVWALDPLINYLSGRLPPTRFGVHYPLTRGSRNPFEEEWRRAFLDDLANHPPAVIVVADRDQSNLLPKSSRMYLDDFPRFKLYLEQNYEPALQAGRYFLWRRAAGATR